MDYAEVRANYEGVDFRRNVMFVDKTYFVMADEVRDDASHTYQWRLHGHGGGDGGGSYERNGGLAHWTQTDAELLAYMPEDDGIAFSERDTVHSFDFLEEPTHTMMLVEQTGDDVEFLTILYPRSLAATAPGLTAVSGTGGKLAQMQLGDLRDLAWLQDGSASDIQFTGPAGTVQSDGRFGMIRYDGTRVGGFNVQDGSSLTSGSETLFTASEAVDMSLELALTHVDGFVRGPDSGYTIALSMLGSVEGISFTGDLVDMVLEKNLLTLELAGEGILNMSRDTAIFEDLAADAEEFVLLQNYPNPFNAQTNILYKLDRSAQTQVRVFNLAGQQVRRIVDRFEAAGTYQVAWDGKDDAGKPVASGVYVLRLRSGSDTATRRLLLLK